MRALFAAGGTAGHINPALATAIALKRGLPGVEVTFVGSSAGIGAGLIKDQGYELDLIEAAPAPRRIGSELFATPRALWSSVEQALAVIHKRKPDVVVGFGGYVAAPVYLAAKRAGVPLVIHEANARAGWANKMGARLTRFVGENYPGSLANAEVVGMPIAATLVALNRQSKRAQAREHFGFLVERPTLLVTGGSQGARRLNEVTIKALPQLEQAGIDVLHICGTGNLTSAPTPSGSYRPVGFVSDMSLAYSAVDLVCSRAGATTVAETGLLGLPSLFVPLPIGNGEQRLNAAPYVKAGLAEQIDNDDFAPGALVTWAKGLVAEPGLIDRIAGDLRAMVLPDGAQRLASLIDRAALRVKAA